MAILAEEGAKSVTHRAVAARAGLPHAATTYFFESIDELTEEALRLLVTERVVELRALTEAAASGGGTVEEVARRFAAALSGRATDAVIGQFEVYLEAARHPALRVQVAEALDAFEALAEATLRVLGSRRPAEAAVSFVALLDGYALHRVARNRAPGEDLEALNTAMRQLFIASMMDEEELERWDEHLRRPLAERSAPTGS